MSNMETAKQREALSDVFKATGGRPPEDDDRFEPGTKGNVWRRRKNWTSQKDPSEWEGVVTELGHDPEEPDRPSGPVHELHLEYVGMQGRPKVSYAARGLGSNITKLTIQHQPLRSPTPLRSQTLNPRASRSCGTFASSIFKATASRAP